jgi:hypothetical protein
MFITAVVTSLLDRDFPFQIYKVSVYQHTITFNFWYPLSKKVKCGAKEGWKRLAGPITLKMLHYAESNGKRIILYTIKQQKANWDGHVLSRICFLHHVIEGNILVHEK